MRRTITIKDEVRLERRQAQPLEQIDKPPGGAPPPAASIDSGRKEMLRALPRSDSVFIHMIAAIDDHVVEQLTRQVEHRADGQVGNQFPFLAIRLGAASRQTPDGCLVRADSSWISSRAYARGAPAA